MSPFDFDGRIAAITGGAHGIGAAVARAYADAGGTAVVLDIDEVAGRGLASEPRGRGAIEFATLDVADREAVHRALGSVAERHGRIDGLVCAAIVQPLVDVVDIDEDVWRRAMAVNVDGVVWSCQAVLPTMMAQRSGAIVTFVSGTADFGKARSALYTTSKGAVAGYTKTLAREVAAHGVRVNACRPGVVDTPQFRAANPGADTSGLDVPEDVAGAVSFLLSEHATLTGSLVSREMAYRRTVLAAGVR